MDSATPDQPYCILATPAECVSLLECTTVSAQLWKLRGQEVGAERVQVVSEEHRETFQ